jgi:hypothetical protein
MLLAAAADDVQLRVVQVRPLDQPGQRRALERRQVLAGEIADKIGSGEDGLAVNELQWWFLPCAEGSVSPRQLACHDLARRWSQSETRRFR